jgi:prolyl-tRNA synthetase
MGALIMTHGDDNGLVLPPNLAPIQVIIVPIFKTEEQQHAIAEVAEQLQKELRAHNIRVKFDNRENLTPGFKFNDYELKGVPVRIAIGPKDLEKGTVEIARRDTLEKSFMPLDKVVEWVRLTLPEMQTDLFEKAKKMRDDRITTVNDYETFKSVLNDKGGFIAAHWDGTPETEEKIKKETKATIRCIPLDQPKESGQCIYSGKPSTQRVLFAKAY